MAQSTGRRIRRAAKRRAGQVDPVRRSPRAASKEGVKPLLASPKSQLGRAQRAYLGIEE